MSPSPNQDILRLGVYTWLGVLSTVELGLQSLPCLPGQDELLWARGPGTISGRAQVTACDLASSLSHLSPAEEDGNREWRNRGQKFKSKGDGLE